jgi:hypothetical protein
MTDMQYEPAHTGLLLVDPYNDFLSEGGGMALRARKAHDRRKCDIGCK